MPLYVWRSAYLKEYGDGTVAVAADDPEAARAMVRESFEANLRERREWLFCESQDDDDRAQIAEYRALLEADIAAEPDTVAVLFVPGSS